MGKPRKSPLTKVDLLEIWCFVGENSPAAADRLIKQMDDAIDLLGRFPGLGSMRGDLAKSLRIYPVGHYVIAYRVVKRTVHIIRVVHGARDLRAVFAED
jgi:toxin ParE1/3/4